MPASLRMYGRRPPGLWCLSNADVISQGAHSSTYVTQWIMWSPNWRSSPVVGVTQVAHEILKLDAPGLRPVPPVLSDDAGGDLVPATKAQSAGCGQTYP